MTTDIEYLQRKNSILMRAFVLSGIINLIVLSLLSYWIIRERPPSPYCDHKPQKKDYSSIIVEPSEWVDKLEELSHLSFNQLVDRLGSNEVLGNTYREKDVALGCLTTLHHFDIKRALAPQHLPSEKHLVKWSKESNQTYYLAIYPTLKKNDFKTISHFAITEKWPLTTEGLFINLQKQTENKQLDMTLVETIALTSEFWTLALLLNRSETLLNKYEIATLMSEGNWDILSRFVEEQRENHDLSDERRRKFLLEYINQTQSVTAAELFVKVDEEYIIEKMDDAQIINLLKLLTRNTPAHEHLAKELLISPRSEQVWQSAAVLLYTYAGEKKPENWNYQCIISRFIKPCSVAKFQPFKAEKKISQPAITAKPQIIINSSPKAVSKQQKFISYQVQKGDTLWKISKKFKVNIDSLKTTNQMKSDTIKPGITLKIPIS